MPAKAWTPLRPTGSLEVLSPAMDKMADDRHDVKDEGARPNASPPGEETHARQAPPEVGADIEPERPSGELLALRIEDAHRQNRQRTQGLEPAPLLLPAQLVAKPVVAGERHLVRQPPLLHQARADDPFDLGARRKALRIDRASYAPPLLAQELAHVAHEEAQAQGDRQLHRRIGEAPVAPAERLVKGDP